jgi:hypothetical protein
MKKLLGILAFVVFAFPLYAQDPPVAGSSIIAGMTESGKPTRIIVTSDGKIKVDGISASTSGATETTLAALKDLVSDGTNVQGAVTSAMTGTTSTSVIAGVASNYQYITHCSFNNDHAATSTYMNLQDGTGGTVLASVYVPFAGGREVYFGGRGLKVPTAGNGLYVVNVTTGSSTTVSCNGYRSTTSY